MLLLFLIFSTRFERTGTNGATEANRATRATTLATIVEDQLLLDPELAPIAHAIIVEAESNPTTPIPQHKLQLFMNRIPQKLPNAVMTVVFSAASAYYHRRVIRSIHCPFQRQASPSMTFFANIVAAFVFIQGISGDDMNGLSTNQLDHSTMQSVVPNQLTTQSMSSTSAIGVATIIAIIAVAIGIFQCHSVQKEIEKKPPTV